MEKPKCTVDSDFAMMMFKACDELIDGKDIEGANGMKFGIMNIVFAADKFGYRKMHINDFTIASFELIMAEIHKNYCNDNDLELFVSYTNCFYGCIAILKDLGYVKKNLMLKLAKRKDYFTKYWPEEGKDIITYVAHDGVSFHFAHRSMGPPDHIPVY